MTWSKYRRLLLVLLVPLLIAGGLFTVLVIRPSHYATIICANSEMFGENCRMTDGLGESWDERLRAEHPAWFDIHTRPFEVNNFPYATVSGSQRFLTGVKILDVQPYAGTDDSPGSPLDQLRSLSGQEITIVFGNKERDERPLNPLGCNELDFEGYPASYIAGLCGIPNGVARVKFSVDANGASQLAALKSAIDNEVADARQMLITEYLIGIPLFFVLFIVLSGVVWVLRKAITYVKAG